MASPVGAGGDRHTAEHNKAGFEADSSEEQYIAFVEACIDPVGADRSRLGRILTNWRTYRLR